MTFSMMALLTPMRLGISLSSSPHLWLIADFSPVVGLVCLITPSNVLNVACVFFCVSCSDRITTMSCPARLVNRSLMLAFTSGMPAIFGSCTKRPLSPPGGERPVVAYLRHSMMVVFPQPFAPTIMVRGL